MRSGAWRGRPPHPPQHLGGPGFKCLKSVPLLGNPGMARIFRASREDPEGKIAIHLVDPIRGKQLIGYR